MKKTIIFMIAISLLLITASLAPAQSAPERPGKSPVPAAKTILVYYFHNNYRCATCKKIEAWSHDTVTSKFADEIKKGVIIWKTVNVDEKANRHFIREYKIITKQIVLVEMNRDVQTRWKNLDKIWELIGDRAQFSTYVENEIKAFEGGS